MVNIAGYQFEDPYNERRTSFNEVAAVYVILDAQNNKIDVGETNQLKTRLASHERRGCWKEKCKGDIYVAVYQEISENERLRIEQKIRRSYHFPCGEV